MPASFKSWLPNHYFRECRKVPGFSCHQPDEKILADFASRLRCSQ
jgi:hypothetical protein